MILILLLQRGQFSTEASGCAEPDLTFQSFNKIAENSNLFGVMLMVTHLLLFWIQFIVRWFIGEVFPLANWQKW